MHRFGGALVSAHEHRPIDAAQRPDARSRENFRHARKFLGLVVRLRRAGQMMQRQHGMGLAAAEIGLQSDYRVAAFAGQPRTYHELRQGESRQ
ncbi:MAG: hypothetical protein OXH27_01695 [Gammaproteobacteria bacterium]|nr:hypothetical protein [Gammaproteobacteria bacterium]